MKSKLLIKLLIISLVLVLPPQFFSCKKIDLKKIVLLRTLPADAITFHSAQLKGEVIDAGEDGNVTEYGFVYGSSKSLTLEDERAVKGNSTPDVGTMFVTIDTLNSDTRYYYKAYTIENDGKVTFGDSASFKTAVNPFATVPLVGTVGIFNITPFNATAKGVVAEDGGANVSRRGFCISTEPAPNIVDDPFIQNGTGTGQFEHTFINLTPNTQYFVRAFAENAVGISYGGELNFTTEEAGGIVNEWLFYDDGVNVDGIGLNDGGGFDVAIRFTPQQLAPYNGFKITKIKFFPKVGLPCEYYVEVFTGQSPTIDDMVYDQFVENPLIDEWNIVDLDVPQIIDASDELWIGYFVNNQQSGTFPAGIDDGPGENGYGDMLSVDNLGSWLTLADAGIDANWNIQVFVTNEEGVEMPMVRTMPAQSERSSPDKTSSKTISLQNSTK